MSVESQLTKRCDERTTYYFGLAGRIAFAVTSVGAVCVAGWFVFEALALGSADGLRNAILVAVPPIAGMAVFTALQIHWKASI